MGGGGGGRGGRGGGGGGQPAFSGRGGGGGFHSLRASGAPDAGGGRCVAGVFFDSHQFVLPCSSSCSLYISHSRVSPLILTHSELSHDSGRGRGRGGRGGGGGRGDGSGRNNGNFFGNRDEGEQAAVSLFFFFLNRALLFELPVSCICPWAHSLGARAVVLCCLGGAISVKNDEIVENERERVCILIPSFFSFFRFDPLLLSFQLSHPSSSPQH